MKKGTAILLLSKEVRYLVKARKEIFHTKEGGIDLGKIKKFGDAVTSTSGTKFTAVEPTLFDRMKKTKRGPQIILKPELDQVQKYLMQEQELDGWRHSYQTL